MQILGKVKFHAEKIGVFSKTEADQKGLAATYGATKRGTRQDTYVKCSITCQTRRGLERNYTHVAVPFGKPIVLFTSKTT